MSARRAIGSVLLTVGAAVSAAVAGAHGASLAADANLAVSASSVHSDPYLPQYAVDGNPETRWASGAFHGAPHWLQIDFGKVLTVENLSIHWERAYATEYRLQVSEDGQHWQTFHETKDGQGGTGTD